MRPLRALAGLALLVAAWLWWRAPALVADLDRYSAAAHVAQARIAHERGEVEAALGELRIALAEEPSNGPARALWRLLTAGRSAPARPAEAVAEVVAIKPEPAHHPLQPAVFRPEKRFRPSPLQSEVVAQVAVEAMPVGPGLVPRFPAAQPAEDDAAAAYAALSGGNRRAAADAFRRALGRSPSDPRADQWRRQLALIEKRWSVGAYTLLRDGGGGALAATPVLGAGQSGAQFAYALDPLSPRPLSLEARLTAPNRRSGPGSQAALGVSWRATETMTLTAERLFATGGESRNGWTLRAAGGFERRRRHLIVDAYGEAGAVGSHDIATYAAAQGHITRPLVAEGSLITAGIGGWVSLQHDARTVRRFEIGPSLRLRRGPLDLSADYRLRLAGNAAPGSGPALTLAAYF